MKLFFFVQALILGAGLAALGVACGGNVVVDASSGTGASTATETDTTGVGTGTGTATETETETETETATETATETETETETETATDTWSTDPCECPCVNTMAMGGCADVCTLAPSFCAGSSPPDPSPQCRACLAANCEPGTVEYGCQLAFCGAAGDSNDCPNDAYCDGVGQGICQLKLGSGMGPCTAGYECTSTVCNAATSTCM
jgi:hypothetical protein